VFMSSFVLSFFGVLDLSILLSLVCLVGVDVLKVLLRVLRRTDYGASLGSSPFWFTDLGPPRPDRQTTSQGWHSLARPSWLQSPQTPGTHILLCENSTFSSQRTVSQPRGEECEALTIDTRDLACLLLGPFFLTIPHKPASADNRVNSHTTDQDY
jgi:hypothetical protein